MPENKSANQLAIEAFAAKFDPPLQVAATRNIGGNAVYDGWMCALHVPELEMGVTATAWGKGHFKAWIEASGYIADAVEVAEIVVAAFQYARLRQHFPQARIEPADAGNGAGASEMQPATPSLAQASLAVTEERREDLGSLSASLDELAKPPFDSAASIADAEMKAAAEANALAALAGCKHDFQESAPGARKRCWKCGLQEPKAQPAVDESAASN